MKLDTGANIHHETIYQFIYRNKKAGRKLYKYLRDKNKKPLLHTITSDNGKEFAYHKDVSSALDTDFYFANPYHSWERGLNEHTNGLIRQYIPKKSEFENISKEEIVTIQNRLNHRPRKSLNYKTPFEVFMTAFSKKMAA